MNTPHDTPPSERTYRNSISTLSAHRKCPQAWAYREIHGLVPDTAGPTVRRDLGSWWHALRAADSIDRGILKGSLRYVPERLNLGDGTPGIDLASPVRHTSGVISGVTGRVGAWDILAQDVSITLVLLAARRFWASLSDEDRDAWQAVLGERTLEQHLQTMNLRWNLRWEVEMGHESPLGVEVQWTRAISSDPGEAQVRPLQGMVDEVYLDTRRNIVVVRDHKSSGALGAAETADNLLDSQLHVYAWGVSPTIKAWDAGLPAVRAIAYDRARTKAPTAPVLTQMGSLSKSVTDYDLNEYLAFTGEPVPFPGRKKDGSQAGEYLRDEAVVERLSSRAEAERWNTRTLAPININVVRSHLRAARSTYRDILATVDEFEEQGEATRNFTRMGCGMCDFQALCLAEVMGGPGGEIDPGEYGLRLEKPRD